MSHSWAAHIKAREAAAVVGRVVAFTGHRPGKLGGYDMRLATNAVAKELAARLRVRLEEWQPDKAICGMALGFDLLSGYVCLQMGIPLVAAIPFPGFNAKWPAASMSAYHYILRRASQTVEVSPPGYAGWKLQRRNEWMVDHSNLLVACWDGTPGGTLNCLRYADGKYEPGCYANLWDAKLAELRGT